MISIFQNFSVGSGLYSSTVVLAILLFGAVSTSSQPNPAMLEPELAIGRVIGNYPNFPPLELRTGFSLSYRVMHVDTARTWPRWMNHPATGITFGVHRMGNDAVYGYETFAIPFVDFSPSKSLRNRLWFRIGMGATYFNRHYFSGDNVQNKSIGSALNWAFQVHLYKSWNLSERLAFRAGLGYLHASNGHTQLPNFGLNSFAAELAATVFLNNAPPDRKINTLPVRDKPGGILIYKRLGIGLQEFGGTTGPVGGAKRPVYSSTVGVAYQIRKPWKIKAGLTYRYYAHINQQFVSEELKDNHWQASNLLFNIGSEFMMGHFGIDVEVGLNLFKPYYREFYDTHEGGGEFSYFLKRMFPSRFGMNAYLISNEKNWRSNLYLGAFICANFGEADFSEVSLTYVHRLGGKN